MQSNTTPSPNTIGLSRHESITPAQVGVVLVNLGTPDSPDTHSVRRYLAEFLSDRRVIELHPWLWKPVLHGFILPARCRRGAEAYAKIWHHDTGESPLRFYTRRQSERLGEYFAPKQPQITVAWAMRYGTPSIPETLANLTERGCRRILIAPLYPQYSATTTASIADKVFESLRAMRDQPAVRMLPPYYDRSGYINALATSIEDYLHQTANRPKVLIASFHGLPEAYVEKGDPYYAHCVATTGLLQERLQVDASFLRMSFQSRFGPKKWLRPYTDETLLQLADSGIRDVAIFAPGFAADCLETLEELGIQNRDRFLARGGHRLDYIPCLNDSAAGMQMLSAMVEQELSGWIET
jgi:protoporphyrin/coproporphyrin ferrochelatase